MMKIEKIFTNMVPSNCLVCGRILDEEKICSFCKNALKVNNIHRCKCCFRPFECFNEEYCLYCQQTEMPFSSIRYLWEYKTLASIFIKNMKYNNELNLLFFASNLLLEHYEKFFDNTYHDIIIPSPSSTSSLYQRGFLHTNILATKILQFLHHKNYNSTLVHFKNFPKNYKRKSELSISKRIKKSKICIDLKKYNFHNKKVLFIDDMITTGSTALNMYNILKDYDLECFDVYTLAIASDFYDNFEKALKYFE